MKHDRVLLIAPWCDGTDVGEAWSTWQWARRLSERHAVTVLTCRKPGRPGAAPQLPAARVVEWPDVPLPRVCERFRSMAKPGYPLFAHRARRWIRRAYRAGERFGVIHQVSPLALRYASPGVGFPAPLVVGPLGGSLEAPAAFASELSSTAWYTKLRGIDRWRIRFDPGLRRTIRGAALVLGVAPYVRDLLGPVPPRRFELMSETGIERLPERAERAAPERGALRLLYVGRVVRNKGVRDAVRAMGRLTDLPNVRLEVVGDGEDLAACRRESEVLGVASRVYFHGRKPRGELDRYYREADAFLFPSFREPSGNVVFESMSFGLPVIAADAGGPGYVVDESSGILVPVRTPAQFADDLAGAVRRLAADPSEARRLGAGARERVARLALWDRKVEALERMYEEVSGASERATAERMPVDVGYAST